MNRSTLKQAALLTVTAFFCVAVLFSGAFIAPHLDHNCTGDAECPVCIQIQGAQNFLKHIKNALIIAFFGMAAGSLARGPVKKTVASYPLLLSAITLKIRLNT